MLLRNESKVRHYIDINLVFDDNTTRDLIIQEGDFVHMTYRKDGCVKVGTGIITGIEPYIKARHCNRAIESAIIILDMSEENIAYVEKIKLEDIIDIKFVNESLPCEPPIKPTPPCLDKYSYCGNIFPSCKPHHCPPPCTLEPAPNCSCCCCQTNVEQEGTTDSNEGVTENGQEEA